MSSSEGSLAAALQGVTLSRATAGRAPAFFRGAKHGGTQPYPIRIEAQQR